MKVTVVGAGLAAATASSVLKKKGHDIEVFECRPHIAGNCFDSSVKGVEFTTMDLTPFTPISNVWDFVNQYASLTTFATP